MAKKETFPRLQSKDGKYARQPSNAAAYHQLVFDGWAPVKEESEQESSSDKTSSASTTSGATGSPGGPPNHPNNPPTK